MDRIKKLVNIISEKSETVRENRDAIIRKIKTLYNRKELVPVVCEDMYEYEDPKTKERQPLHSYFVERILSQEHSMPSMTDSELKAILDNGYYGFSLLQTRLHRDIYEDLYYSIFDDDGRMVEGIHLKKCVADFLRACDFPVIITTCCFPIIERELGAHYSSYWSELERKNDEPLKEKTVFHVFGEAKPNSASWGYDDKQVLRFLRSAYSTDYSLKNLTSLVENNTTHKTLMFLGNNTPDWLFRFILTPLYGGDVYENGKGFYMISEGKTIDESLSFFLEDIHFEKESQMTDVLEGVLQRIAPTTTLPANGISKYVFFIAHASEDKDLAMRLAGFLREKHQIHVWADFSNIHDGRYWQRIMDGLSNSAYFMPLITSRFILKTCSRNKQLDALRTLGMKEMIWNSEVARELNTQLEGVQVELMLADRWVEMNPQDPYCIPLLVEQEEFFDEPLTEQRLEHWSQNYRRLPTSLFWGIQMHRLDRNAPEKLNLDWDRYRLEI